MQGESLTGSLCAETQSCTKTESRGSEGHLEMVQWSREYRDVGVLSGVGLSALSNKELSIHIKVKG